MRKTPIFVGMGKRKANLKAKHGGKGRIQMQHEAGKRTGKRPVKPMPRTPAAKAGSFEEWAEKMVSNPLEFLSYTVFIIFVAVCIKMLIF